MKGVAIRTAVAALVCAATFGLYVRPADAGQRVALVIGNGAYRHVPALANPRNDAADVSTALRSLGFDVIERRDATRQDMANAIGDFSHRLEGSELAVFYYSGHGIQMSGRNFLVPIDAEIKRPVDISVAAIDVAALMEDMEQQTTATVIFLDACRDNPFASSLSGATRSLANRGLAQAQGGIGTLIAFATAPDKVAQDGPGRNSPFTASLLRHIRTPGLEVRQMLTRVRSDVIAVTNRQQIPWDNSSLTADVFFVSHGQRPAQLSTRSGVRVESGDALIPKKPPGALGVVPNEIRSSIAEAQNACSSGHGAIGPRFIEKRDLNGDGVDDYILDYGSGIKCNSGAPTVCGTGGCLFKIFMSTPSGVYKQVLERNARDLNIKKLNGQTAVALAVHGIYCGYDGTVNCEVVLVWDAGLFQLRERSVNPMQ